MRSRLSLLLAALLTTLLCGCQTSGRENRGSSSTIRLLNVSYDPTRELYARFNPAFAAYWKKKTGQTVRIQQSHGASGKQSQAVINGLPADVVTLGIPYDIDQIARSRFIAADWQKKLPNDSLPYTSTIAFLVRKGNPKQIRDWSDLVRPGVQVITPNPKVSSGGRWNYVAAWGYALKTQGNDAQKARDFVTKLYANVPILDTGARAATQTFAERGQGDVLLSWENEAFLARRKLGRDKFEIVLPSLDIVAEPPVAVVDKTVDRKGTRAVAEAYLNYLYSPEGQTIIAQNGYRPVHPELVPGEDLKPFPKVTTFTFAATFPSWATVQATHFKDGGIFDQIYRKGR